MEEDVDEADTEDENLLCLCPSRDVDVGLTAFGPTGGRRWSTAVALCIVPNFSYLL